MGLSSVLGCAGISAFDNRPSTARNSNTWSRGSSRSWPESSPESVERSTGSWNAGSFRANRLPAMSAEHDLVLVVDYGAQYAQLIARRVREARVYSEIVPHTTPVADLLARRPQAIVLSGGPSSVYEPGAPQLDRALLEAGLPVFGICYGFMAMAQALGGTVARTGQREYGRTTVEVLAPGRLLDGLPASLSSWMSHGDEVTVAPQGFVVNARSPRATVAAFEDPDRRFAGVQWHPEVLHSEHGQAVLENFLFDIAGCRPTWTSANIAEEQVRRVRDEVGDARVMCGLSGGVDSAVAAAIVQRAVGDQLTCVFVDHGLLREGEAEQVERDYVASTGVRLVVADDAGPVPVRAGRRERPGDQAQDHRPGVHPDVRGRGPQDRRGRARSSSSCRARCTPTWWSPVAARARPTSRATTTWVGCPTTCSSRWSSRCARCSRTRCVQVGPRARPARGTSSGASRSRARARHPHRRRGRRRAARPPAGRRRDRARRDSRPPAWTTRSGSAPSCCWPTCARSACRGTGAPTATRSCCGRSPARTP